MHTHCANFGVTLLILALPTLAGADPIPRPSRSVSAGASVLHFTTGVFDEQSDKDDLTAEAQTSLGPNAASSEAVLSSHISADGLGVTGRAGTNWAATAAGNNGERSESVAGARVDIFWLFTVEQPQVFNLTALFTKNPLQEFGFWQASLQGPFSSDYVFAHASFAPENFRVSRRLDPGQYDFQFETNTAGEVFKGTRGGGGDVTFSVSLTAGASPTPEPTSIALLAIGLLAASVARRRRVYPPSITTTSVSL
jgi:hypothetical protein